MRRANWPREWLFAAKPSYMPRWVFVVQIGWAIGLLWLFLAFTGSSDGLGLPHAYGHVPVEAPWLGAVGGLLASLGGIAYYSCGRWEPRFNYWHPIKPLSAAATGAVSCVLIIVLLRAATGSTTPQTDATTLDAAAFIFGFGESAFRQLITAVTDVFLKPGRHDPPSPGGA